MTRQNLDSHPPVENKTAPPPTTPEPATEPESFIPREVADELRRRYADLSALYVTGAELSATLEWEPLIEKMVDAAIHLVCADDAALVLIDEYHGDLYIAGASHLPEHVIAQTRLKPGEGVVGWVMGHREAVLLVGPVDAQQYPKFFAKPDQIGSAIVVPLIPPPVAGRPKSVVGALAINRRVNQPPLTQDDLELVTALTTQAAAALENAALYKQMQRSNIQLANLIEIGRQLTFSLDLDRVLRVILEKATELLQCEAGSLLLVDPDTDELIFKVALGPAGTQLSDTRLPPGAGIAGAVARSGKPLIVNDPKADPRHYVDVDASTAQVTHSLLCVPLISKEHTIGVLEVLNKTDGTPFDEQDRDSLAGFAIQSSIALGNAQLYSDLRRAFTETVKVITNAVEARDPYTAGHSERVTTIALETARELGWSREQIEVLEIGSLLHDIGKIGVSDAILLKPGPLTDDEWAEMKKHPVLGAKMLESISQLRQVLPYILYHQERYDGKGYPFGLAGTEIPIEGRMLAVLDTLDAMTSNRPYRPGLTMEDAIEEIKVNRATQFDPDIVDALLRVVAGGKLKLRPMLPAIQESSGHAEGLEV
ncbi:MAG: GAF domain-containing protein [Chloroflexi bacterium]|nr:GAF domain-containing protein [Chloroflexota bacterium]